VADVKMLFFIQVLSMFEKLVIEFRFVIWVKFINAVDVFKAINA
jgi:hypothetical protein